MSGAKTNGFEELSARIRDLCDRSERNYCPCFTAFLTPEEQVYAAREAETFGGVFMLSFGGFGGSERNVFGFFPEEIFLRPSEGSAEKEYHGYFPISFVLVSGSGYREFSHRDVLGSLISLGIKREMIGDIYLIDPYNAYVAVIESVADFICRDLEYVSRDKVKTRIADKGEVPEKEQKFEDISLTVSSMRLDAVVASLLCLARDKAKKLIDEGRVSINHEAVFAYDRDVREGDVLSVKGYGRFKTDALLGQTSKGRHRVVVRKYI